MKETILAFFGSAMVFLVNTVGALGYPGIILLMAVESSFIPFPSEVVIPPAGYLTVHGDMNIVLVAAAGILGSLIGASINYSLAFFLGRKFLIKYQRFLFLNEKRIDAMDTFFRRHGEITTFAGRLIPGVRQLISLPAGLARMGFGKFIAYTALGAGIWVIILAYIGRFVGNNAELVKEYSHRIGLAIFPIILILLAAYILITRYVEKKLE
ncbi:MAG: DedA family protein [Deferribacteraceae bacterium]|jgi:membrane protein DedA with SNARE-associated domain|nr:DedA family protein [Deferribacteraceae bacterium]